MRAQAVSLTFSIKYLSNFAKSTPLSDRVQLHMSNEVPLLVQYSFDAGNVRYYLACVLVSLFLVLPPSSHAPLVDAVLFSLGSATCTDVLLALLAGPRSPTSRLDAFAEPELEPGGRGGAKGGRAGFVGSLPSQVVS